MRHKFRRLLSANLELVVLAIAGLLWLCGCNLSPQPTLLTEASEPVAGELHLTISDDVAQVGEAVVVSVDGTALGSLTYSWSLNGEAQAGQSEDIFTFTPDTPDLYVVEVEVRDGSKGQTLTTTVTVEGPLPTATVAATESSAGGLVLPTYTPIPATPSPMPTTPSPIPATPTSSPTPTTPPPTDTPVPTSSPTYEAVVVAVNGLNLRSGPGVNYDIVGFLNQGDPLDIQGRIASNDWIQVSPLNPGTSGWVAANQEYVIITGDLNTFPLVTPPPPPLQPR